MMQPESNSEKKCTCPQQAGKGNHLDHSTDYVGSFVYENEELEFIHHPEGRWLPPHITPFGGWGAEFHLKDHLGNLRVSFRDAGPAKVYTAGLELVNATSEELEFDYITQVRNTQAARTGSNSAKLTTDNRLGIWKSFEISKRDKPPSPRRG